MPVLSVLLYVHAWLDTTIGADPQQGHRHLSFSVDIEMSCGSNMHTQGTILPQPDAVLKGLLSEELSLEDVVLVAMSPKYPRAKYR